jgi:DNA-binding beta-propeller fold protein YncE
VADFGNDRIQKFSNDGDFISKWGTSGSEVGQFMGPAGLAIDSEDNIYVTDRDNDRIQIFTSNGTFITSFGSEGSGDGQFNRPEGVGVDRYSDTGLVYVADTGNSRIQVFNLEEQSSPVSN